MLNWSGTTFSSEKDATPDHVPYRPGIIFLPIYIKSGGEITVTIFVGTTGMFTFFHQNRHGKDGIFIHLQNIVIPFQTMSQSYDPSNPDGIWAFITFRIVINLQSKFSPLNVVEMTPQTLLGRVIKEKIEFDA